jgi:hypothetical protein
MFFLQLPFEGLPLISLIVVFIIWLIGLVAIANGRFYDNTTKLCWFFIVLFLNVIGILLFLFWGKKEIAKMEKNNTMTIKTILLISVISLFAGCCSTPAGDADNEERLIAFSLDYNKQEILFTVVSHGCTVKNDFGFTLQKEQIIIKRKRKDDCKAMPEAVSFTYSMKDAGISPDKVYAIKNRFIANPNLADIH